MTNPGMVRRARSIYRERHAEIVRFARFCVVGAIGAVVDFSILNLGIQVFGLPKWLANTFSFFAAVLSNFVWNRRWTYPETKGDPIGPQLSRFLMVNLVGYGINQAIFLSLDRYLFTDWGPRGYNLAKVIAIGVVLFWNFGVNRVWTYGKIK
jgi:putative flippase GtrA